MSEDWRARAERAEAKVERVEEACRQLDRAALIETVALRKSTLFAAAGTIRAALAVEPSGPEPTTSDAEPLRVYRERSRGSAASDEPARCPHGETEEHEVPEWGKWQFPGDPYCPGPAASGTPETTR